MNREWTQFACDAEVASFGTGRLVKAHNALRAEVAALKAELEKFTGPLTDEDEVAVDLLVDTEHSSIQDIDAAIREVRSK